MGTDIHGWVETKRADGQWHAEFCICSCSQTKNALISRHYDAFGCLFGVRNYANFEPVVERYRDMPESLSPEVEAALERWRDDAHSQTWVTWAELAVINWDEETITADGRVHVYERDEHTAQLRPIGKSWWSRELDDNGVYAALQEDAAGNYIPDQEIRHGNRIYRTERLRRRDVLEGEWIALFTQMGALAESYSADGVRLVVWFDC